MNTFTLTHINGDSKSYQVENVLQKKNAYDLYVTTHDTRNLWLWVLKDYPKERVTRKTNNKLFKWKFPDNKLGLPLDYGFEESGEKNLVIITEQHDGLPLSISGLTNDAKICIAQQLVNQMVEIEKQYCLPSRYMSNIIFSCGKDNVRFVGFGIEYLSHSLDLTHGKADLDKMRVLPKEIYQGKILENDNTTSIYIFCAHLYHIFSGTKFLKSEKTIASIINSVVNNESISFSSLERAASKDHRYNKWVNAIKQGLNRSAKNRPQSFVDFQNMIIN